MERIRFPHHCDDGSVLFVDLIIVDEKEWTQMPESGSPSWGACMPEPGSTDRLVKATRLCGRHTLGDASHVLRLATGT